MIYSEIKKTLKGVNFMDWLQFLQIICLPAFGWLFYETGKIRRDLWEFKEQVAKERGDLTKEFATKADFERLESKIDSKIDGLQNLIIEEFKSTKKVKK